MDCSKTTFVLIYFDIISWFHENTSLEKYLNKRSILNTIFSSYLTNWLFLEQTRYQFTPTLRYEGRLLLATDQGSHWTSARTIFGSATDRGGHLISGCSIYCAHIELDGGSIWSGALFPFFVASPPRSSEGNNDGGWAARFGACPARRRDAAVGRSVLFKSRPKT